MAKALPALAGRQKIASVRSRKRTRKLYRALPGSSARLYSPNSDGGATLPRTSQTQRCCRAHNKAVRAADATRAVSRGFLFRFGPLSSPACVREGAGSVCAMQHLWKRCNAEVSVVLFWMLTRYFDC